MMRLNRHHTIVGLLFALASMTLNGCMGWRAQSQLTRISPDAQVRLTRSDGSEIRMRGVTVRGDSLFGALLATRHTPGQAVFAVLLRDVDRVNVRRLDKGRTVALGLSVSATLFMLMLASASALEDGLCENYAGNC
ncbi:MAG TPA: hypothetical protein VE861_08755 [Gemmatimonadaceae bacterium]|nr:hypothetical protein [Gemmatimonadaceae bacterium]